MSDQLKDWFEQHRDELDMEAPPTGHSERFAQKLNKQESRGKSSGWLWAAAAAVVVLLAVSFLIGKSSNSQADPFNNSLSGVSPEMAEVEEHFATQVAIRLQDLNTYKPIDPSISSQNKRILEALEAEYETLKKDLEENPQDQRVVNSMIQNYRTRIKVMDRMVNALESINHKTHSNEELHI